MHNMVLAAGTGGGYITNNILNNAINFLAPLVGLALVIFVFVQGWKIVSGNETGSVKKLVSGVLLLLFILGIMFAAGSFDTYGNLFKSITDTAVQEGGSNINDILK